MRRPAAAVVCVCAFIALAIATACGEGTSNESAKNASATFTDGLTPEVIIDRSNEADASVTGSRIRIESTSVFMGRDGEHDLREGVAVGDRLYLETIEGDGPYAIFQHEDGRAWVKETATSDWEPIDPRVEEISTIADNVRQKAIDDLLPIDNREAITRLPNQEIDGRPMFAIEADLPDDALDIKRAFEHVIEELQEQFPESEGIQSFPDELVPDEWVFGALLYIGVDDYYLYRMSVEYSARNDDRLLINGGRTIDIWDHNAELVLPIPFPDD